MAKRFRYTDDLDLDLLDQVVLINPWSSSWEKAAKAARAAQPRLGEVTTKGIMDRCHLLMAKRKKENTEELKASGIEGQPQTLLTIALDEALLLKEEAEREHKEKKASKAADSMEKAKIIRDAALGNLPKAQPSGSNEDEVLPTVTVRRKRRGGALEEYANFKRHADEERERRRSESEREEREFRRREAEAERELRREELDLRRQELALQAKRDAAFFELLLQKK